MTDSESRIQIFTTGYPRSGNTWLNRLLSDLLSSPLQTLPGEPLEYFGKYRNGNFVIRKRHVPAYKGLKYNEMRDSGYIIFIQRDPRDVAVSAMFYRGLEPTDKNLMDTIATMVDAKADVGFASIYHEKGMYLAWINSYMDTKGKADVYTQYETLHKYPIAELQRILFIVTGIYFSPEWVGECYNRQKFKKWASKYPGSMRKGIVGDWKNYFKQDHGYYMAKYLNYLMKGQGYIQKFDWWKELPE